MVSYLSNFIKQKLRDIVFYLQLNEPRLGEAGR